MAYIFKASDGRTTSIHGYDIPMFISRNLFLNLFYVSHTNECCIFAIARRRLLELTSDSLQSLEKLGLLGRPMQLGLYWLSRASIDFCRFECVGLQQLLELLLRS